MSTANFNQFHNADLQDSVLQEQFSTTAAVQELSDAELESVAGGLLPLPVIAGLTMGASSLVIGSASLIIGAVNLGNSLEALRRSRSRG